MGCGGAGGGGWAGACNIIVTVEGALFGFVLGGPIGAVIGASVAGAISAQSWSK